MDIRKVDTLEESMMEYALARIERHFTIEGSVIRTVVSEINKNLTIDNQLE